MYLDGLEVAGLGIGVVFLGLLVIFLGILGFRIVAEAVERGREKIVAARATQEARVEAGPTIDETISEDGETPPPAMTPVGPAQAAAIAVSLYLTEELEAGESAVRQAAAVGIGLYLAEELAAGDGE